MLFHIFRTFIFILTAVSLGLKLYEIYKQSINSPALQCACAR